MVRRMSRGVREFLLGAAFTMLAAGCAKPGADSLATDAPGITSKEITLETYKSKSAVVEVPPGNRNPAISWETLYDNLPGKPPATEDDGMGGTIIKSFGTSTKEKFKAWAHDPVGLRAELEKRFQNQLRIRVRDKNLRAQLTKAAAIYDVDPVLILSCVLAEHTFNVGFGDMGQDVVMSWADRWEIKFNNNKYGLVLTEILKLPQFEVCQAGLRSGGPHSDFWICAGRVWDTQMRGHYRDASKTTRYPYDTFKYTFFDPRSTGFTYGLGQLDPIRALMVTDIVHAKSGFRLLSIERANEIYQDILNQETGVHYLSANVRLMVDTYREKAGFDISKNPGLIATLYNVGGEGGRAQALYDQNVKALSQGRFTLPMENYAGFFINEHEAVIRQAWANGK